MEPIADTEAKPEELPKAEDIEPEAVVETLPVPAPEPVAESAPEEVIEVEPAAVVETLPAPAPEPVAVPASEEISERDAEAMVEASPDVDVEPEAAEDSDQAWSSFRSGRNDSAGEDDDNSIDFFAAEPTGETETEPEALAKDEDIEPEAVVETVPAAELDPVTASALDDVTAPEPGSESAEDPDQIWSSFRSGRNDSAGADDDNSIDLFGTNAEPVADVEADRIEIPEAEKIPPMELTETAPEPEAIEEIAPEPDAIEAVAPATALLEPAEVSGPEGDPADEAAAETESASTPSSDGFRVGHGEGTNDNDGNDIVLFEVDMVIDPDGDSAGKSQIGKR
ncbi:MAG: hypothetical protein VCD33_05125 [Alphaproteobacteria bacterium]